MHVKATLQAAKEMSTEKQTGIGRDPSFQGTREGSRLRASGERCMGLAALSENRAERGHGRGHWKGKEMGLGVQPWP